MLKCLEMTTSEKSRGSREDRLGLVNVPDVKDLHR